MSLSLADLSTKSLGPCRIDSPFATVPGNGARRFVEEDDRVLYDSLLSTAMSRTQTVAELPSLEPAGPRRKIYFDPTKTRCAIVTCGGLCPGLNDVIRGVVMALNHHYGVRTVYGFQNGYEGFVPKFRHSVLDLTPDNVGHINEAGGTILGSSRGEQDPIEIVDCLERMGINALFVVGGDGTIRGALAIAKEVETRGLKIAIVGIPKTIDNDIKFLDNSFGFRTAFSEATKAIRAAHVEAKGAFNGVGLVRLMGRHSGFIACYASLAMSDANFVLIPEVPFKLEGENGFLNLLRKRLDRRKHAVIVVAEGAGQDLFDDGTHGTDASGNVRLRDIGIYLKNCINDYFARHQLEVNVKYFDPSYLIRSVPANPPDSVYCLRLAHCAVHAAMAGRTETLIGRWHGKFVQIPMPLAIRGRNTVDPHGDLWLSVLESTGQPMEIG